MTDESRIMIALKSAPLNGIDVKVSDVISRIEADDRLDSIKRRDLVSALRSICCHRGLEPALMPATHAYLRKLFSELHPKQMGVSHKTFQNLRALVCFALNRYVTEDTRRGRKGLNSDWQSLWDRIADTETKFGGSRLVRYLSDRGRRPEEVTSEDADAFSEFLHTQTLVEHPDGLDRRCRVAWNKAVRTVQGWPQIPFAVPDNRNNYAFEWEQLPAGLRKDAEAWLTYRATDDPFSLDAPPKPARAGTIKQQRFQLRQLVSALALKGYDLGRLTSLQALVDIEVAKLALRFFWERQGSERLPNSQIGGLCACLISIAKHWCRVDPELVEALKRLKGGLVVRQQGLTRKNRERLRPFTDRRNIEALLMLSEKIIDSVRHKNRLTVREALDVQVAIALEFLLMLPIRRVNLVTMRVGPEKHLLLPRKRGETAWVVINANEVKNAVDIEAPLPPETTKLLVMYMERIQPFLAGGPSHWLFPGQGPSGHKSLDQVSRHFPKVIRRWTGLDVNMHLMRHIGAKLYLDQNPGAYEVVRRVLGHKALSTTMDTYTGLETDSALRHYEAVILGIRQSIRGEVGDD